MKPIYKHFLALLAGYATRALALFAEGGPNLLMMPGFRANSDYSTLGATRYIIVAQVGAYGMVQGTDPTSSLILGVLQNNPSRSRAASIKMAGPSKIVAGAALGAGAMFTTNGSGRAAAVRSGDMVVGRILEASSADGDIVSAMLFPPVRWFGVP